MVSMEMDDDMKKMWKALATQGRKKISRGTGLEPIREVLRTPDTRFVGLEKAGYTFKPHYVMSHSHAAIRIHYIDEGPRDASETILCMHGEPSWCFLYRKMVPVFVAAGYRVICPDLVGFGRSDKPSRKEDHTYERHVDWISDFLVELRLNNVTLFAQDWGGLIGLRIVARFPERFLRVAIGNTGLPIGTGINKTFAQWIGVSQMMPSWRPLMQNGTVNKLDKFALDAYDAPFPNEKFKAATRAMPPLVPVTAGQDSIEENKGAWRRVFKKWNKPFLTCFSDSDAVSKNGELIWKTQVPGAKFVQHHIIKGAGHFLQEDKGEEIAKIVIDFMKKHKVPLNSSFAKAKL